MSFKSVLIWPACVSLGWHESCENKSEDTNHSEAAAKAVCETLIRKGLGCDGRVFPIGARVEVDDEVTWEWSVPKITAKQFGEWTEEYTKAKAAGSPLRFGQAFFHHLYDLDDECRLHNPPLFYEVDDKKALDFIVETYIIK